jgi:hypothetical protein
MCTDRDDMSPAQNWQARSRISEFYRASIVSCASDKPQRLEMSGGLRWTLLDGRAIAPRSRTTPTRRKEGVGHEMRKDCHTRRWEIELEKQNQKEEKQKTMYCQDTEEKQVTQEINH